MLKLQTLKKICLDREAVSCYILFIPWLEEYNKRAVFVFNFQLNIAFILIVNIVYIYIKRRKWKKG